MIYEILTLIDKLLLIYFTKIKKNRSGFHEGSMGLTISRGKRLFFLSSTVKNAKNINRQITVKKFQDISNLTISADLHGHLALEESLNWKNQFPCSQPAQKTTVNIITQIDIFFNSRTKFPLNNH